MIRSLARRRHRAGIMPHQIGKLGNILRHSVCNCWRDRGLNNRGLKMRMKFALLAMIVNVGSVLAAPAQKPAAAALAGRVSSDAEGPMEGVLVRAKGEDKSIGITVVSDQQGRYSFPASRLVPGKFKIDIR